MNGNEEQNNVKTGFFSRIKGFIDQKLDDYEEKQARRDIIFTETITPQAKPAPKTLVRGGIDMQLLLAVVALLILGATMSFSASYVFAEQRYGDSFYFFVRYLIYAAISVVGVTIFLLFFKTLRFLKILAVILYGFSIILLLLVLVMGRDGGGAQRWLQFGPVTIQPSEIAKTAVVMMLALYMAYYEKEIKSVHKFGGSVRHGVLMPGLIIGLICGLVMLEKHISGVMIIGFIGLAVMFVGGTHKKWIFLILGSLAVVAILLVLVSSYAQTRVDTWINIDKVDPRGEAWQTLQGLYAIGSGGIFGLGLGNSRQKYGYVSQPQNDFIFTIICEELGFFGALLIIGLFAFLVYRGFKIAQNCPDRYMQLVAYGLTFKVALQVIMNIAVVTNSMPNTGISLPFFSSGGTALVIQIAEMGILLFISRYSAEKRG